MVRESYPDVEEMSTSEYDAFWGWGEMPERFWDSEADKLGNQFSWGEITLKQLEDSLDDMMGITRMEGELRHAA